MRFLRNKILVRCICLTMCIITVQPIFVPTELFALSSGPAQTEYTSYETSAATDMVNLSTGDFSYSMPVMNIPGPEGGFDVPLFYHAGINPEADASWVGLGWNINVGAITRSISGYPDDGYDHNVSVSTIDTGGSGYVKNYIVYTQSWDSETGRGGAVSLFNLAGVSWNGHGAKNGTLLGVEFNKNGSTHDLAHDAFQVGMSILTLASGDIAGTAAIMVQASAMQVASTQGSFISNYLGYTYTRETRWFRTDYKYFLDDTRNEKGFGALYSGSLSNTTAGTTLPGPEYNKPPEQPNVLPNWPRINDGSGNYGSMSFVKGFPSPGSPDNVANDMFMYIAPDQKYSDVKGSSHVAYDNFNVMTGAVSGSISPYRLEIGSMVQPKRVAFSNISQNLVPFIPEDNATKKVQFRYNGQFENGYTYHDDATMGITHSVQTVGSTKYLYYDISNAKLKTPANRIETDVARIKNNKIASGRNIEWYSNEQIVSNDARNAGFIDTDLDLARTSGSPMYPAKGIGGFSITDKTGTTYHYALPVYRRSESELVGVKGHENEKYSKLTSNSPTAISWLLTGVTGPDFVDRGTIGYLDDADWGYWVKFNYGKTTADFSYRAPYLGYIDDGTSLRYSAGVRDEYYLNTVETRSHIAMFIKSPRTDGLSSYRKRQSQSYGHPTESDDGAQDYPVAPLKLDEIALLSKEDYQGLVDLGFTKKRFPSTPASETTSRAYLGYVIDGADLDANSGYRNHVNSKALKRIKFVYEANENDKLCKKALNSFADPLNPPLIDAADIYASKQGKLTLKRVQYYGRNNAKVFPDVKFDYASNPDYDRYKWDGWGLYNSVGNAAPNSHRASSIPEDAAAWSLTKITTPLDAQLSIAYERDRYSSISGFPADTYNYSYANYAPTTSTSYDLKVGDANLFNVGDQVQVIGAVNYHCGASGASTPSSYNSTCTVVGVNLSTNVLNLGQHYMNFSSCSDGLLYIESNAGTIAKISMNGGDVRVATLTYSDSFGKRNTTKYSYSDDAGLTTGVVAKEPELVKSPGNLDNHGLDKLYDVPNTPVIYGRVSVMSNYDDTNFSFTEKNVYEFETPATTTVTETNTQIQDTQLSGFEIRTAPNEVFSDDVSFKQFFNKVEDRTSRIGAIKQITQRDQNNSVVQTTSFGYSEATPSGQGKYTSGSIMSEWTAVDVLTLNGHDPSTFKLLRTAKTQFPYCLTTITTTRDGYTSTIANKTWDFFTGDVLVKEATSESGTRVRTETVPAYTVYPEMGLKSLDPTRKNMLSQTAGGYSYLINGAGTIIALQGGIVSTWSKNWTNYRILSSGAWGDGQETESALHPVWRQEATYSFIGDNTKFSPENGLKRFGASDAFNYANPTDARWYLTGKATRFNHYSVPLERLDNSGIYASSKMSNDDKHVILSAVNSKYKESAFSGAEDLNTTTHFFGGEVAQSNGAVVTTPVHSGSTALQVSSGTGFVYKTQGLRPNHAYRAIVWCNSINGRLYFKANGVETTSTIAPDQVGSWYRLTMDVPVASTFSNFEVGVKSNSGTVVFDDFRFQPTDAQTTAYVYSGTTGQVEYELDSENFITKYEYNDAGLLIKVYQESIQYNGLKLVSEKKYNYRRFSVNQ